MCSTEPSADLQVVVEDEVGVGCGPCRRRCSMNALASRSKSAPSVDRASQPRPTRILVRPGASLVSETLPPLLREMGIGVLLGFGEAAPRTVRRSGLALRRGGRQRERQRLGVHPRSQGFVGEDRLPEGDRHLVGGDRPVVDQECQRARAAGDRGEGGALVRRVPARAWIASVRLYEPLVSRPVAVALGSATLSVESAALLVTVAASDVSYSRARAGTKGPRFAAGVQ